MVEVAQRICPYCAEGRPLTTAFMHRLPEPYVQTRWDTEGLEPCEAVVLRRVVRQVNADLDAVVAP